MMKQRPICLTPLGLTVFKITYPPVESTREEWKLLPMRFIEHSGRASK
jgi:hypothetical protein